MTKQQQIAAMLLAMEEDGKVDGDSLPWAQGYIGQNTDAAHEGDCPHVSKPAPFTCSRCQADRLMTAAYKILTFAIGQSQ